MKILNKKNIFMALLAFFVLLILFSNIKGILYNCFHAYDFGIYQQGIFNIAAGESLNPYLTVRGFSTFNDHFMPVLFLALPFVWISNFHPVSLIVFEWSWFVLFLFLIFRDQRKEKYLLYSLALIIFSKGILTGLEFPIHPGTWSMPVWYLLILSIKKNEEKKILFYAITLCMFREAYPFGTLLLGLFYLYKKRFSLGFGLFGFSSLYLYFVLSLRSKLLGPTADYGGKLLKRLLESPVEFIANVFSNLELLVVFKLFLPCFVLLALVIYLEKKKDFSWRLAALCLTLPIYGIHFLTNQYHFHYGPAFMAPLLSVAFLSPGFKILFEKKNLSYVVLGLFIATASGRYTKFFNNLIFSKNQKCTFGSEYKSDTKKMLEIFSKIDNEKVILASGGVVQRIMRPGIKVYPPHTMVAHPALFDVLLLLRNGAGDTYPWNSEQVEEAIVNCAPYAGEILLDTQFYYLALGQFPRSCINVYP